MMAVDMKTTGWCWEGFAFDPGVDPTIYGVGEGATYFGVDGANYIFHPNDEVGFAKLAHIPKVTAEISKWEWYETEAVTGRFTFAQRIDGSTPRVIREAETVSRLSLQFPNITAAFIDDTHAVIGHETYTTDTPRLIREALAHDNPDLDFWIVVYTHEDSMNMWAPWVDYVDVVNLWIWSHKDLVNMDRDIDACHEMFPDKDIIMGVYIRDYPSESPVPIGSLELELEGIAKHLDSGSLAGYNILGACLIDQHPAQAEFIRDFIAAH